VCQRCHNLVNIVCFEQSRRRVIRRFALSVVVLTRLSVEVLTRLSVAVLTRLSVAVLTRLACIARFI
jgi:hypothetical protein